jgi:hypothetical protein
MWNKGLMWRTATIFEEGEDNHERHPRVELRTACTYGKRRNACMRFSEGESRNKASELLAGYED